MPEKIHRLPPSSLRAFTLIELLACIAVIGILAAILVPVIGEMRFSAGKAQLASNLRSVHAALMAYASDSSNVFPGSSRNENTVGDNSWQAAIAPYVNEVPRYAWQWYDALSVKNSVMRDPLDISLKTVGSARSIRNIALNGLAGVGDRPMGVSNRELYSIEQPARLLALTTGMPASNGDEYNNGMRVRDLLYQNEVTRKQLTRVSGRYYCVFVDGHLEVVPEEQILVEARLSARSLFFDTAATNAQGWNP